MAGGHESVARLLLEVGANKACERTTATDLMSASRKGHLEVVRLLLKAGADKDLAMNDGSTALMRASQNGHLEVTHLLLESGAAKDLARNTGMTALMVASGSRASAAGVRGWQGLADERRRHSSDVGISQRRC